MRSGKEHAGIQGIRWIERTLDRAHGRDVGLATVRNEPTNLRDANPMLSAHRAPHADRELQGGVVDGLIIGVGTEDVDVEVPIAHMAIHEGARVGVCPPDRLPTA